MSRIATFAVALGIGGALAAAPGMALADTGDGSHADSPHGAPAASAGRQATPAHRAVASPQRAARSTGVQAPAVAAVARRVAATSGAPGGAPIALTVLAATQVETDRRSTAASRVSTAAVTTTAMSPNLLVNPGAEAGDPSLSGFSAVSIPGWVATGTPTVIQYGTPRNFWPIGMSFAWPDLPAFLGFPSAQCAPANSGNQFFGGGNVATSSLTQTVDLSAAGSQIDAGAVTFNLSGELGGFLVDPSSASVSVDFLDANQGYLGSASTGPVTVWDRWLQTGFQERATAGAIPEGTRFAQVTLDLQDCNLNILGPRADYNNAYADNLSFTISSDQVTPAELAPQASTVGQLDHVFMVYMENKGYNDILGSPNAPYLNSLINAYGFADNYYGLTHPSLPNYYPIVGGTDFGLTYNCASACIDASKTLVSNIDAVGKTWRGYAQSLTPGANPLVSSGDYAVDETPFPAFRSIANDPAYAAAHILPLEQMAIDLRSAATAPDFAWFFANEDFNGEGPVSFPWGALRFAFSQIEPKHQYNVAALDQFLSANVPTILNSNVWGDPTQKSVLVITFDEDNNNTSLGFGNEGNHIVTVVIPSPGAVAAGMRSGNFTATNHYNHYSLLRMIEDSLGLPPLTNNDRYAAPMNEFWNGTRQQRVGSITV